MNIFACDLFIIIYAVASRPLEGATVLATYRYHTLAMVYLQQFTCNGLLAVFISFGGNNNPIIAGRIFSMSKQLLQAIASNSNVQSQVNRK